MAHVGPNDVWSHVAAVFSEADENVRFYLDGVETGVHTAKAIPVADRGEVAIGTEVQHNIAATMYYWPGYIQYISLFNRVLTPAELVADQYAEKDGPIGASCLSSRDCQPGLRCDSVRMFRFFHFIELFI